MIIQHVSASDKSGGAARAAYRIHRAMRDTSIESQMLVQCKIGDDPYVYCPKSRLRRALGVTRPYVGQMILGLEPQHPKSIRCAAWLPSGRHRAINRSDVDVVNLHWVCGEMLTIKEIGNIRKPTVWTMHDMWPFCGSEHYAPDEAGVRWQAGYTMQNRALDSRGLDLDLWSFNRKRRAWGRPIHLICPSRWLTDCVKRSALMHDWPVTTIPYPLDIRIFKPLEKAMALQTLDLNRDRKVILFGALGGSKDPRKGFDLLQRALLRLAPRYGNEWQCLVLGQGEPIEPIELGFPVRWMGPIHDEWTLAMLYNAADVTVVPSRQDNLPQSGAEAQACGCPVVGFRTTGLPDVVDHKQTGYLAEPYSVDDLAEGILWTLKSKEINQKISEAARKRAICRWSPEVVIPQYVDVYRRAIEEKRTNETNKDRL